MKVISLGIGVQSTAMYIMSSTGELPRADYAIFADTGGEKTETLEYLEYLGEWMENNNGIPLIIMDDVNLEEDIKGNVNSTRQRMVAIPAFTESENGKEGMLKRQCTFEYKIKQVDRAIRKIHGLKYRQHTPPTEIWTGITLDEMHRMKAPREKWKTIVYPFLGYDIPGDTKKPIRNDLLQLRRSDLIAWYHKNKLPIPEKSSCVFCPFQSDANWLRLKKRTPEDFNRAVEVDLRIRSGSKQGIEKPIFLHKSLKPLSDVSFDANQTEMWGDCEGFCHI